MPHFQYQDSPFQIREDIKQAHADYWQRLSSPGSWWTGAQRIAIANEVRRATSCHYCQQRKEALSPYNFSGEHNAGDGPISEGVSSAGLSTDAIDAIHRIVTDQTRITKTWIDGLADAGLSHEAYVELTGVVVAVFSIDEFNRGLGLSLEPLPQAQFGEASHYRPPQAEQGVGFVPMIPANGAVGQESDLWSERSANVLRALSLVPNAVREWRALSSAQYLSIQGMANLIKQDDRSINRMQMELVAGRVSSINECFY
jgi:hypothetical protein